MQGKLSVLRVFQRFPVRSRLGIEKEEPRTRQLNGGDGGT